MLDNCEHLIDAAARMADTLLRAGPGACVIATSREPLRAQGEYVNRVASLDVPAEGRLDPTEILRFRPTVVHACSTLGLRRQRPGTAKSVSSRCSRRKSAAVSTASRWQSSSPRHGCKYSVSRVAHHTRGRLLSFKPVETTALSVRYLPRLGPPGLSAGQHCPDRSRQLVRDGGDGHAIRSALQQSCQPWPCRAIIRSDHDGSRTMHEERSQVGIAALADAELPDPSAYTGGTL